LIDEKSLGCYDEPLNFWELFMSRICALTGKTPKFGRTYTLRGIAKKKKGIGLKVTGCTNRRFLPNLKTKRLWIPEEKRFVTLRLSVAALRTIDKNGVSAVIRKMRKAGKAV
jgi:large subunit ribosomal protein L28